MITQVVIHQQGDVIQIKRVVQPKTQLNQEHVRASITHFSAASRRRLITLAKTVDWSKPAAFLTLTYAQDVTPEQAHRDLKVLFQRIKRKNPFACAIWRMELTERGRIHFHIIWFGWKFIAFRDLRDMWREITGQDVKIIRIERLKGDKKKAGRYVAKYMAKNASMTFLDTGSYPTEPPSTGRWWGTCQARLIPVHPVRTLLFGGGHVAMNKLLDYLIWAAETVANYKAPYPHAYSRTLWFEDGNYSMEWLKNLTLVYCAHVYKVTSIERGLYGELATIRYQNVKDAIGESDDWLVQYFIDMTIPVGFGHREFGQIEIDLTNRWIDSY